jgi:hypothetical protein
MSPLTFKVVSTVIHERLDGEVIVLDMLTGKYFSLDGCAADIWTLIHSGLNRTTWDVQLRSAYGQSTSFLGIDEFVTQLMELGLITPDDQSPCAEIGELPADRQRHKWTQPVLHSYDDLTDLILIDPVHDTSEEGWPSRG